MASFALSPDEQKRKRSAYIVSSTVTGIILILMILKFFHYPDPPPPPEGILVNLGLPDQGQGEENTPGPLAPTPAPEKPLPAKPQPEIKETKPVTKPTTTPVKDKPVVTTDDPNTVAIRERQEKERRDKAEADRVAREQAEARQRAEAAERKRQEDAQALKDQLKGGLSGADGKGKGKGETGTSGNQGDKGGDPNSDKLKGLTTGSGERGGALVNRGVVTAPKISDNSQDQGVVVLDVCVDDEGKVVSATFTQRGSQNATSNLISLATNNIRLWKFTPAKDVDKQCGTVTYRFKVQ